jgi:predicted Zn finger-like uncharacterized protein
LIIECESCKAKFSLDDSRVGPKGVKVKCTKCQNIFVVRREDSEKEPEQAPSEGVWPEEAPPEEAPPEQAWPGEKPPEVPAEEEPSPEVEGPLAEDFELGFEEERPQEGAGEEPFVSFEEPERPEAEKQEPGEFEFSFDEEKPLEEKEEKAPGGEEVPGEFGFGFEEEKPPEAPAEEEPPGKLELGSFEEERPSEGAGEEPSITFGEPEQPEAEKQEPGEFEFSIEEEKPSEPEGKPEPPVGEVEEETIPFSIGGEEEEAVPAGEKKKPLFAEEEEKEPPPEKAFESLRKKGAELKKARRQKLITLIAALVLVAGGAFAYLSGTLDTFFKKAPLPRVPGTLMIEKLEGIFEDNKHFGRVFALEGRIKNTSDESQQIQAVKGIIYNKQGDQVASRTVAPGRIISKEELKTLTKAEILKHFKDLSAGFVPQKGTIPIMVVFTELPSDMDQAKIEVIR